MTSSSHQASPDHKQTKFDPDHGTYVALDELQTYKKGKAPITGTAFGDWAGRDVSIMSLPGGSTLTFDLSRLTSEDYRQMRWHPQINISLSVLNFMFHQIEWQIIPVDGKDPKALAIAAAAERNLHNVWSQMVGCINQAFWAGYSPSVIEWENDPRSGYVEISHFKDLVPEECVVNWKIVEGWAPPGKIKPKFKIYDGIRQLASGSYPVPTDNSLWYPLLMENGDYYGRKLLKPAFTPWYFSTLVHLFANRYYERFGEPTPVGRAPYDADVETDTGVISGREAMERTMGNLRSRGVVTLPSDRDPVTKEFDYTLEYLESQMRGADFDRYLSRLDEEMSLGMFTPMLLFRSGDVGSNSLGVQHTQCVAPETPILCADYEYRPAGQLKVGQEIIAFNDKERRTRRETKSARRSWEIATIQANRPASKVCHTLTMNDGREIVASYDHPWFVVRYGRFDWMETADLITGDMIVNRAKSDRSKPETFFTPEDCTYATVKSVSEPFEHEVASIQTSTGTFIADGLLCHNTFLWMLNGIYGDIKYYIDKYILERWKTINFGPNAPDIQWSFHKMGRESQETVRAIINALISGDKVSVDLDELGQALGMSLTEIRATQDNPAGDGTGGTGETKPGSDPRQRDDKKTEKTMADTGEPRATSRKVSSRIESQIRAAWKKATFNDDLDISLGFERRMAESFVASGYPGDKAESLSMDFYRVLDVAVKDLCSLGMESFSGPADVMAMVNRHIDMALDRVLEEPR